MASRAAFPVPPHLQDPSGAVSLWFTDPPGSVMQFTQSARGTVEMAKWLVGPALAALLQRFPGDVKVRLVMDLTLMTGRDPAVRPILTETTKKYRERILHSTIVAPQNASAVYLAALHASVALLRAFGVPIVIQPLANALFTLRAASPESPG